MPNPNTLEKSVAAITTAAVLGGLAACERQSPEVPDSRPSMSQTVDLSPSAPSEVVDESVSGQDGADIVVYPVAVDAKGFKSPKFKPGLLRRAIADGWAQLGETTHDMILPRTVTVLPVKRVKIPGITSVPDFCNEEDRLKFRDALLKRVVPKDAERRNAVVVLEQKRGSECALADAGPGTGVVVYAGSEMTEQVYAHEFWHTRGIGHDNKVRCLGLPVVRISGSCKIVDYGNLFTVMGDSVIHNAEDADPLTAFALKRLYVLTRDQVKTVDSPKMQQLRLEAINNDTGLKAIRIPVIGTAGKGDLAALSCITGVYIEASGGLIEQDEHPDDQILSLKMYAVNERPGMQDTYLLPLGSYYSMGLDMLQEQVRLGVGNAVIRLQLQRLQQYDRPNATGTADVRVGVEYNPAKEQEKCTPKS